MVTASSRVRLRQIPATTSDGYHPTDYTFPAVSAEAWARAELKTLIHHAAPVGFVGDGNPESEPQDIACNIDESGREHTTVCAFAGDEETAPNAWLEEWYHQLMYCEYYKVMYPEKSDEDKSSAVACKSAEAWQ